MSTLVIHAPDYQVGLNSKRSFDYTCKIGKGSGYAINKTLIGDLKIGMSVALISRRRRTGPNMQVDGTLRGWTSNGHITGNGIPRYDLDIQFNTQPKASTLNYVGLNRNGVQIIS
jgi:hypothetical protein